jgi:hypothetical protein
MAVFFHVLSVPGRPGRPVGIDLASLGVQMGPGRTGLSET